ncbi:WxcM-like domain-containing protein [Candidatus Parcubacteria bacterium]|nr:WxcM-like domain-containing protein [Candidatus Parcubacteria bacterium]
MLGGIKLADEFIILENTPLCMIIGSKNKVRPGKTDRSLAVCFRKEDPIFKKIGFEINYIYSVCLPPETIAGNHYHEEKREIFYCPFGQLMIVSLEDPKTTKRKEVLLSNKIGSEYIKLIYIKPGIAHSVINTSDQISSLMVFSNIEEHNPEDDFPYEVL